VVQGRAGLSRHFFTGLTKILANPSSTTTQPFDSFHHALPAHHDCFVASVDKLTTPGIICNLLLLYGSRQCYQFITNW